MSQGRHRKNVQSPQSPQKHARVEATSTQALDKVDSFSISADSVILSISQFITNSDKVSLAKTNRRFNRFFKDSREVALDIATQTLQHVAFGEQDLAEDMLRNRSAEEIKFLASRRCITDRSNRHFFDITLIEKAYWDLDKHMATMLKKYISERLVLSLLAQLRDGSPAYVARHGKHFDPQPLIAVYTAYITCYQSKQPLVWLNIRPGQVDYINLYNSFIAIGKAWREVPVNFINEICRPDRSFVVGQQPPDFNDPILPRVTSAYGEPGVPIYPLKNNTFLGKNSVIMRGDKPLEAIMNGGADSARYPQVYEKAVQDLAAIKQLVNNRLAWFEREVENLNPEMPTAATSTTLVRR